MRAGGETRRVRAVAARRVYDDDRGANRRRERRGLAHADRGALLHPDAQLRKPRSRHPHPTAERRRLTHTQRDSNPAAIAHRSSYRLAIAY